MYQNFNVPKAVSHKRRLQALRALLSKQKLDGFLIPRSDLHQNEYIEPRDSRLEWITGFTGSAGLCLVTLKSAHIFVDGRYKIQVKKETDTDLFQIVQTSKISFQNWFEANCKNLIVGYDIWLHTVSEVTSFTSSIKTKINFKKCPNLVDLIWKPKPARRRQTIEPHPLKFSGTNSTAKISLISAIVTKNKADVVILTKPESICWLLNIRGKDVSHNPIIQSLAIIEPHSKTKLFLRDTNIPKKIRSFLGAKVEIHSQNTFLDSLVAIKNKNIQIDPESCPVAVVEALNNEGNHIIHCSDPCILPKAIKNPTEIKGAKQAHLIDAVAFINFLYWLDIESNLSTLDEIFVTKKLEEFRIHSDKLEEISFDTICGSGSNGAIVHYRVDQKSNKKIENNSLLLIDSGGQYRMGTTDLTRTIAIGTPQQKMINIFTHVLKGMIKISSLNWPEGLSGQHIDSLARTSLWSIGLDYDHGTGHGIGSYLSVHEGPQAISRRNKVPLQAGMLVSNEPGYYETGKFGVRIENILLVKKLQKMETNSNPMLCFETLTLVPIEKKLLNTKMLTEIEKSWLNNYHEIVYKKVAPLLSTTKKKWLAKSCAPI